MLGKSPMLWIISININGLNSISKKLLNIRLVKKLSICCLQKYIYLTWQHRKVAKYMSNTNHIEIRKIEFKTKMIIM